MINQLERKAEFATNPQQRCACVLLLDTSGSMAGERIAALNSGLRMLVEEVRKDALATKRADIAILTFDSEVKLVQDFRNVDKFEAPTLTAQGQTFLGAGIREALKRLTARKQEYDDHNIPFYRPWLFIMTDGEPAGEPEGTVEEASALLTRAQAEKRVTVFPIGVGDANLATLARIAKPAEPKRLDEAKFAQFFVWLSRSFSKKVQSQDLKGTIAFDQPDWEG